MEYNEGIDFLQIKCSNPDETIFNIFKEKRVCMAYNVMDVMNTLSRGTPVTVCS
jgi:hypothetical protein